MYKYLINILLSILLDINPQVELLDPHSNSIFNFLRSHHTVFYSSCTILHSIISAQGFQFHHIFANAWYFLFFYFFKIVAILIGVWWYLTVVFICIYLMISDVQHLFISFV